MDRAAIGRVWLPLVGGAWALYWIFTSSVGPRGPLRWIGLALGVIGLAGVILARYTLGRSFSVRAKATALVTTGIYSRISNPIYISAEILLIGIVIMLRNLWLLALLIVIIPMQIWRARREARVLEEKFGEEYREYRRRTWF
jgi:protein-S-isoprenylcysteine O-methyltransferase Ste14